MTRRPCALVTGAARGIGQAISIELARSGYDIVGNDLESASGELAETQRLVEEGGAAFLAALGDIADLESHERMLRVSIERFTLVKVLVNNADIADLPGKPTHEHTRSKDGTSLWNRI